MAPDSQIVPGKVNILLVDDDSRNLDVLETILDSPEYRLVRAHNANEAFHALMNEDFALLVLDVRMPDMSGLELAQLIKQRKKTQHLPIIFLTAYYREDEHVLQGYGAGAVDYVSKPCNPAVLRSKVAVFVDLFRANRALQEEIAERRQAELRVAERTAEVQKLVVQLRALAAELTQAEHRERKRVARVLHDYIQQLLVSAQIQLATLKRGGAELRVNALEEVESTLKEALEASRSLTVELSPPILQEAGLSAGLQWLAGRMLDKTNFRVAVECEDGAEPESEEARFLLFECTRELLFNAFKHSGVDAAQVRLRLVEGDRIQVTVEDNGNGFDLDEVRSRSRNTFGLFSIQQRLEHLGGRMEIESSPGDGTRIVLTSPAQFRSVETERVAAAPQHTAQSIASSRVRSSNIGVLIVDDHRIVRQGLAALLRTEPDFEVVGEADSGAAALELAEKLHPDVIIMDVNLGKTSGIQVTRSILARNPTIKVIGLSMHVEKDVAAAMMEAGAVAYLTKGEAHDNLIAAIRSCTETTGLPCARVSTATG